MRHKVVIIDDMKEVVEMLSELLKFSGFEVLSFTLPTEAYNYLVNNVDYDCIVCDINMPVLNGIELFKKFKTQTKSTVPFIFYSGHVEFIDQVQILIDKYPPTTFINKPIDNPVDKVKEMLKIA